MKNGVGLFKSRSGEVDPDTLAVVNDAATAQRYHAAQIDCDLNRARRNVSKQVERRYEAIRTALNGDTHRAAQIVDCEMRLRHLFN